MYYNHFGENENYQAQEDNTDNYSYISQNINDFDLENKNEYNNKEPGNLEDDQWIEINFNKLYFISKDKELDENKIKKNKILQIKNIQDEEIKMSKETKSITNKMSIFTCTKNNIKKLGRKRKNTTCGKHNKFSNDNLTRKLKAKLFDAILNYINQSFIPIKFKTSNNFVDNINNKNQFFVKINQEIIKNINVKENLDLLNTKLKDIFSNKVSKKNSSFGLNYNKNLINKIYKEKQQHKIISILEMNFFQCLEHFRGTKYYEELKGLEEYYKNMFTEFTMNGEKDDYIYIFKYFINNFENYYKNKKGRRGKNSISKY